MLKRYLDRLIKRERQRQVNLGYSQAHDQVMLEADPYHLVREARVHFRRGHYIQALALLQADVDNRKQS